MCIRDSYYEDGDAFVYTYDRGIVHKIPVTTGISDAEQIEILTGLTMEDQVITTWSPEPVSYTHLDVYKRQELRTSAECVPYIVTLTRQRASPT